MNNVTQVSASALSDILEQMGSSIDRDRFSKYFGASGFHKCLRMTGYSMAQVPAPDAIYKLPWDLAKAVGIGAHKRIESILEQGDSSHSPFEIVDIEVWCCREELLLGGFIDAIVQVEERIELLELDPGLCIMEFKTIASKYLRPGYKWYEEKLHGFLAQAQAYMSMYVSKEGEKATQAIVAVFSRDEPKDMRVYRLTPDREWMNDQIEDRLIPAAVARRAGNLPVGEPGRDCNLCGYRNLCEYSIAREES